MLGNLLFTQSQIKRRFQNTKARISFQASGLLKVIKLLARRTNALATNIMSLKNREQKGLEPISIV